MADKLDNTVTPILKYIEEGFFLKFRQVFGFDLFFTESANRKEVMSKDRKQRSYPYCFASIDTFAVNKETYSPKTLHRQGLVSRATSDRRETYKLSLIPTKITYSLSIYFDSRESLLNFSTTWIATSVLKDLNFSILYGTSDITININLADSLSVPKPDVGIAEAKEFELVTTLDVFGYTNQGLQKVQAATSVEIEGIAGDPSIDGHNGQKIFLFRSKQ